MGFGMYAMLDTGPLCPRSTRFGPPAVGFSSIRSHTRTSPSSPPV